MFARLIDILVQIWTRLLPFVVVDEFEAGVVLRLGRFHRSLRPGFHWQWPLIERALKTNTCPYLHDLPAQSVGAFVFRAVVTYRVVDARLFLLGVEDGRSALEDAALGVLARHAAKAKPDEALRSALTEIRRRVKHWGIEVERIAFADHTKADTFRLIGLPAGVLSSAQSGGE